VAVTILAGRQRQLQERYQALASHYNFEPLFCLPRRGNEKPHVENRVKDLERRWATPVPTCPDLAALNAHLRQCCLDDRQRCATGQSETIGQRFGQEGAKALSLPAHAFDACIAQAAKVDKYQTAAFDSNRYSVPRRHAFQAVTVKGYVDEVVVVAGGQVVARHPRCYQSGQQILDPLHYLSTLKTKPACLDHANVYRHWQLPAVFYELRQALEKQHGPRAGSRHFIRVLLLLEHHPAEHVQNAIERSRQDDGFCLEAILHRTCAAAPPATPGSTSVAAPLPHVLAEVQVPRPDLRRFDQLLSCGESHDVPDAVVENQPETAALAGHECRV
jgi:hypothetical protein